MTTWKIISNKILVKQVKTTINHSSAQKTFKQFITRKNFN